MFDLKRFKLSKGKNVLSWCQTNSNCGLLRWIAALPVSCDITPCQVSSSMSADMDSETKWHICTAHKGIIARTYTEIHLHCLKLKYRSQHTCTLIVLGSQRLRNKYDLRILLGSGGKVYTKVLMI